MKKLFLTIFFVVTLLIALLYIFIPKQIIIQKTVVIKAPERILLRYLSPDEGWQLWWPGNGSQKTDNGRTLNLRYKKGNFSFKQLNYYTITVNSQFKDFTAKGSITFFTINADSTRITWKSVQQTSINPLTRLTQLFNSKAITHYKSEILTHLKAYLENEKMIYGISIRKTTVTDTLVLTTKVMTAEPPSDKTLYMLINNLKKYIKSSDAKEINYPIYNIKRINASQYQTMVAIAINKSLPKKDNMESKRMVRANLLETQVVGGRNTVERAINQLEFYMKDNRLSSPAMPFARLVTNRLSQRDTTKWITRIYYPVY